jgi:hypothetical protein
MARKGSGGGDEAGLAAHELDKTDAVDVRVRLLMSGPHRFRGLLYRSVKTEGVADKG